MRGQVEKELLFATALADDILPFVVRSLNLLVLPVVIENGGFIMQRHDELLASGFDSGSEWVKRAEVMFARRSRDSGMTAQSRRQSDAEPELAGAGFHLGEDVAGPVGRAGDEERESLRGEKPVARSRRHQKIGEGPHRRQHRQQGHGRCRRTCPGVPQLRGFSREPSGCLPARPATSELRMGTPVAAVVPKRGPPDVILGAAPLSRRLRNLNPGWMGGLRAFRFLG